MKQGDSRPGEDWLCGLCELDADHWAGTCTVCPFEPHADEQAATPGDAHCPGSDSDRRVG